MRIAPIAREDEILGEIIDSDDLHLVLARPLQVCAAHFMLAQRCKTGLKISNPDAVEV